MFTASQGLINVVAGSLEVRSDIDCGLIKDVDAIAVEAVPLRERDPRDVKSVNEMGDVVLAEEVSVVYSCHGADVERSSKGARIIGHR